MWHRVDGMRSMELGTPGKMRAELNGFVLAGSKRATAGLLEDYHQEGEELEQVGERLALVDDDGAMLGVIEVTAVDVVPFLEVPWEFADAEGEGLTSIDDWREAHLRFWEAEGFSVTDDTPVVCVRFDLVET